MEPLQLTQNMLDLNRNALENAWQAASAVQDQVERISRAMLDQRNALAEIGERAVDQWIREYKAGQSALRKTLDENYDYWRNVIASTVPEPLRALHPEAEENPPKKAESRKKTKNDKDK